MTTFRQCCGEHYSALLSYEPYLPTAARGFVNHLAREPDRSMSAAQQDWADEIIKRAIVHQRIERGQCALPPSLDEPDALEQLLADC